MADFAANVAAAMARLHPTWAAEPGVVAVSGGADSVALLRALHAADSPGGLIVAHLNHQLRGAESDGDEAFVRDEAARIGKSFHVETFTIRAIGGNLEAAARAVRYDWLARVAAETGAGWIATGHTADDQAETVLHRLIRGTGLTGLRGIAGSRPIPSSLGERGRGEGDSSHLPSLRGGRRAAAGGESSTSNTESPLPVAAQPTSPQRGEVFQNPTADDDTGNGIAHLAPRGEGSRIVRPLLDHSRADLLAYLAALDQPFRTDSSNADLQFTRNRIRAEVLPLLRTFNPGIVDVLARLAAQAEEVAAWVADDTRKLLFDAELPRAGDVIVLDGEKLAAAGEVRTRAAVRSLWERERWPVNAMTFAHWRRAAAVALGTHPTADFPDGVHVRRAGKVVQLRRRS